MLSLKVHVTQEWECALEQADRGLGLRLLPVNLCVKVKKADLVAFLNM